MTPPRLTAHEWLSLSLLFWVWIFVGPWWLGGGIYLVYLLLRFVPTPEP